MGARQERRLLENAAPLMRPDERVELVAMAKIGSVKKSVGKSLAYGVAVGVLSGGTMMAFSTHAEAYIVLTDRQILFFRSHAGTPGKHIMSIPRAYAAITEPKSGLLLKFQLHVQGWDQALALTIPPLPPAVRKRGVAFTQLMPRIVLAAA
ncbi:hypothetical protein [Amycolatopsis sp. NPDC021455]|uniref:hypothetical protein n=1 Tax=Amycolatopsis sp. NPDC021455 TaxID=3154901 RepID=UPI0033F15A76